MIELSSTAAWVKIQFMGGTCEWVEFAKLRPVEELGNSDVGLTVDKT